MLNGSNQLAYQLVPWSSMVPSYRHHHRPKAGKRFLAHIQDATSHSGEESICIDMLAAIMMSDFTSATSVTEVSLESKTVSFHLDLYK
jgi:hypothetical protein